MNSNIDMVLLTRPWLRLIENDVYHISKRIKDIEPGYFICYNTLRGAFEVHSSDNKGFDTYCFKVPYSELDYRTLQLCRETNLAMHGDMIYKKMKEENARIDAENAKNFKNILEGASYETAKDVSLAVERDETYDGYKRTHYIGGGIL
ncbi:MAG: hypothetical protein PHE79_09720 [Eubacteriales bacterium]|nr:hypothetical protein [Eubacteriales bacterium]